MAAKLKAADIIENWPNRLEYTGLEKMLMAVSIALLAVTMVRLGLNYGSLPAEIPTHFDFEGKVDGSDGKGSLLILAGVDVACTLLMLVWPFSERHQCTGEHAQASGRGHCPWHPRVFVSDDHSHGGIVLVPH